VVKELKRDLLRKEKALAETAALLVLKRKLDAIWGDEDDGTGGIAVWELHEEESMEAGFGVTHVPWTG
jgi:hypothetical protein